MYTLVPIGDVYPDEKNPRKVDPARLHLLRLSLSKLGYLLPIAVSTEGMVLSGHQRITVSKQLGFTHVPVQVVSLREKDRKGINILFNRATNDFGALDTGANAFEDLKLSDIIRDAEKLPDFKSEEQAWFAINCKEESIKKLGATVSEQYDKKAVVAAENFIRKSVQIPIVLSESGKVVNGVHRLFAALENGITKWPVVRIPDNIANFAVHFLNYLSMDFHVDEEFADMLRFSAYRRPQNNRGSVPKAYRFWANGERTLLDRNSYSRGYWREFRDLHGNSVLDFGSGLCKVAPFLNTKGIECDDFEPYRINPKAESKKPDPGYSRKKAKEFLESVGEGEKIYSSIFLASVFNSIPFPKDRMSVMAIVHSLCYSDTSVYGTCRDISDFNYEYGGIRQANYFVFDSEPGVRLGDAIASPKVQKFHTQKEIDKQFQYFWNKRDYWKGGNVFYWRCQAPKRVNPTVLSQALEFEFGGLPFSDGTVMGLAKEAKQAFSKRLSIKVV